MSGGRIERCPSCGRLIIHGQKCVCKDTTQVGLHAGECWRGHGAATWYWHGEEEPGAYTMDCPVCGETVIRAIEGATR